MKLQEYNIEIDSVQVLGTYSGVLEGRYEYINQHLIEGGIAKKVERFCGTNRKTHIIFPENMDIEKALPSHLVICWLNSYQPIQPSDEWDDGSMSILVFFHEDVYRVPMNNLVNSMICNLKWTDIAENWAE